MSGNGFAAAYSAVPVLAAVRVVSDARRRFDRLRSPVGHTVRVTSAPDLLECHRKQGHVRFVPCAWGSRRDEYRWDRRSGSRQDVVAFRAAAATAAAVLMRHPSDTWADLLPGTMLDVMGSGSNLYLADYWVLVLHHLVWTGRLPYPVHARWVVGGVAEPGPYRFVSEPPTDLAAASREALILLEESALSVLNGTVGQSNGNGDAPRTRGLPYYLHGRWELSVPGRLSSPLASVAALTPESPAADAAVVVSEPPAPVAEVNSGVVGSQIESDSAAANLKLDDQTFTVRYGAAAYRFPSRSKLLFALLERVARRPGHRVDFDALRAVGDVWDGSLIEDSTVRGAVARLRGLLEDQGMGGLAARIQTGTYRNGGTSCSTCRAHPIRTSSAVRAETAHDSIPVCYRARTAPAHTPPQT